MHDDKYCYPNSDVLINKLGITDKRELITAEIELTFLRLKEMENKPIKGNFDFKHLKSIHKHIFQDIYSWAGKERTVEIGKGNLFCTTRYIQEYAKEVFTKYFNQCYSAKDNFEKFIGVFSENYGDLNALHPFREGNGRAQREFARLVCLKCGYIFSLRNTTHQDMLNASILSFNKGDNSAFEKIFSDAITSKCNYKPNVSSLSILTSDDLDEKNIISTDYGYERYKVSKEFDRIYKTKVNVMKNINTTNYGKF